MHTKQPRFKLTRQAMLLGLISAAYPMTGYCVVAGRADFVIGNVEAVTADGSRRTLSKGSAINEGDAINTATGARAQLRFIDGGYVSLQPDTQFRVDQFNYKNKTDGSEKGFFSLLKGSLRAITGNIGRTNRETYKVITATATIGIRGTGYKAEIRDDGLFVSVGEGAILLSNNAGTLVVSNGNAAFVANINTLPANTKDLPRTPPARIQPLSGSNAALTQQPSLPKLASGSGYRIAYAYNTSSIYGAPSVNSVAANFDNSGPTSQLTKYSSVNDTSSPVAGTAGVTFATTDGTIGWGRWDGNISATSPAMTPGLTPGSIHYVIGQPTAVMPTSGAATYSMMGHTDPTATNGSTGYSVNGTLSVNFSTATVGVNMIVANSTFNTYTINTGGTPLAISGSNFSGSATENNVTNCTLGCTTSISGFFAGTNASRAGLSYSINNITLANRIQGVAVFASPTP